MCNLDSELRTLPLFADLRLTTLQELLRARRVHTATRNAIISIDALSHRLFVLLEGRMKMVRPNAAGDEALQQCMGKGDIFCPVAMLASRPCCSYAQCLGACKYVSWPHRLLRRLLTEDGQLQANLLNHLATLVEVERTKRCLHQCGNVNAKVATCLLAKCNSAGANAQVFKVDQSFQVDLRPLALTAQELGIARETLSRTLALFERAHILCSKRGVVELHAFEVLRKIADGERICLAATDALLEKDG
ncbi:MAG: Crp/Fnr family transcriptional regulator [Desulfuromonadaceae bacterium]|nr:Crp/Fnr family transcriptional regulator [Desulfuromonadaceae bacterium]